MLRSILNVVRVWVENYPYFLKDRVLLKEVKSWLSDVCILTSKETAMLTFLKVEKSGKFKDTLKLLDKLTNAASATPAAPPPREVVRQKDIPRLEAVNYNGTPD